MTNGFSPFYLGMSSRRKWRRGGGANNRLPPSPSRSEQEGRYRKWRGHSGVNIMGASSHLAFHMRDARVRWMGERVFCTCVRAFVPCVLVPAST